MYAGGGAVNWTIVDCAGSETGGATSAAGGGALTTSAARD